MSPQQTRPLVVVGPPCRWGSIFMYACEMSQVLIFTCAWLVQMYDYELSPKSACMSLCTVVMRQAVHALSRIEPAAKSVCMSTCTIKMTHAVYNFQE